MALWSEIRDSFRLVWNRLLRIGSSLASPTTSKLVVDSAPIEKASLVIASLGKCTSQAAKTIKGTLEGDLRRSITVG